jgi:hypothetical protein
MSFQMLPPPPLQWQPSYIGPSAPDGPIPPPASGSVPASGAGSVVAPASVSSLAPAQTIYTPAQLAALYAALPPLRPLANRSSRAHAPVSLNLFIYLI